MKATITKTKDAQPMGPYQATAVDTAKAEADFRITSVSPYYIAWKDGRVERVTKRQLEKLQASHTFMTDF